MIRAYRDPGQFKAYFVDTGLFTTLVFQGERYVDNAMMWDVLRGKFGVNRGLPVDTNSPQRLRLPIYMAGLLSCQGDGRWDKIRSEFRHCRDWLREKCVGLRAVRYRQFEKDASNE